MTVSSTSSGVPITWPGLHEYAPLPGITGSVVVGAQLSAAVFRLEPGAVVPRHSHVNEEFGQVLEGSLELDAGTERTFLATGGAFLIPGDLPHAAVAGPEGCLLLECYAPVRNPFAPQPAGAPS